MSVPPLPSKGKRSWIYTVEGHPLSYEVIDEHVWSPADNAEKALCVHRLRFDDGHIELRIGYYMIGKKGRGRGKWLWAQFAPMLRAADLQHLCQIAQQKGWLREAQ